MKRQAPEDNSPKKDDVRVMLNAKQVLSLIAISRTTLFRLEREKLFPQGQAITPHRKLWFKDEVIAWQRDLQDEDSALSQKVRLRPRPKRRAHG